MDALLVNWLGPVVIGLVALLFAARLGQLHERERHECDPCPRKHRDEL